MKTKNNNPHARFYGLLSRFKGVNKEQLVWQYSDMLTTSLAEFLDQQPRKYRRMIDDMQQMADTNPEEDKDKEKLIKDRELKKRRSAILLRLQKYGIDTSAWSAVNGFMRNPRIAGKTLGEMTIDEMDLLIPKLESILAKDKVKREYEKTLSQLN